MFVEAMNGELLCKVLRELDVTSTLFTFARPMMCQTLSSIDCLFVSVRVYLTFLPVKTNG